MAISCPNCSNELPDDARFCSECGTTVAVEEKKPDYCANCFAELSENAKFCLQCGKPAIAAKATYGAPNYDKTLYEELLNTSPQENSYRAYDAADAAWQAKGDSRATRPSMSDFLKIQDFEHSDAKIAVRAREWAKYKSSGKVRAEWFQEVLFHSVKWVVSNAWLDESDWFRTNKPNHHKALFYENFLDSYLFELELQGAITHDTPSTPTPLFHDYLRKVRGFEEKEVEEFLQEFDFELPDLREIRSWATKDDELFPLPQPVTYEAAGGIISFTTDEAVVIVYLDCVYKGKVVELHGELGVRLKAEVIERVADNSNFCVAIFPPIRFVTDKMKNREEVVSQAKMEVEASWAEDKSNVSQEEAQKVTSDTILRFNYREEFILFKGDVKQIDWRGRRGKVKRLYE